MSIALLMISACAIQAADPGRGDSADSAKDASGLPAELLEEAIFFVRASDVEILQSPLAWDLPARSLRDSERTGIALEVRAPANWVAGNAVTSSDTLEIFLLDGELAFGAERLARGDYAAFPQGVTIPRPRTKAGARFLLFSDTKRPVISLVNELHEQTRFSVVHNDDAPWIAGTAMKEAGRDDVPLRIKHFRNDVVTGARTYLVAVRPGLSIPWEIHDVAEEAYVLEGDFTLPECLPGGLHVGRYEAGGYFYRPPGIAHNGPASGTENGVVMLVRTSGPLRVELVEGCNT